MESNRICPECGAELPANAPQGLCPRCLANMGLSLIPPTAATETDIQVERTGAMIGRYKLLEKIGEGGFGVVFMAEQVEPVQRKVALKIIKAGMDTKEVIARFEAERQAIALMDHPNIARALDAGATEAGRPYFVMELVRGIPITDYCDRENLPTRERLQLFMKVCQAVQHAHQKGVIHRDIKPSNVLVTQHDGEPVPKVIDFGVAKALGQKLTAKTLFTAFHHMIGTPAYMSPEQAALSGLDIDTRADIYSLGVLLYELLTGVTPFDAETFRKVAMDEIRRMIRETEPPKPSTRLQTLGANLADVAKHRGTEPVGLSRLVRGDLDWIVMKCLEKDRQRRYETANGLAADVARHLESEPILARPPSNLYRFQKLVRRHKLAFAAGTAVAAALVMGLGFSTWSFLRERQARHRAVEAESKTRSAAGRAEAAAKDLKTTLDAYDLSQAARLISEGNSGDALAYLGRILSSNPTNEAALTRLATLLTHHSWMVPDWVFQGEPAVMSAEFSQDGQRLLTSSGQAVHVWNPLTGRPLMSPLKHPALVVAVRITPDSKRIVTVTADDSVRVWDGLTGALLRGPSHLDAPAPKFQVGLAIQVSPEGRRIVTTSGFVARLWDTESGQALGDPMQNNALVFCAQFSPDGERVVTACGQGGARVWDSKTGRPLTEPFDRVGSAFWAEFSPDGKWIVTASYTDSDHQGARVWDAQTGQPRTGVMKHPKKVNLARFSPDARWIVTASGDGTARVWNTKTGQPQTEPLPHNGGVLSAEFSSDGQRVITASQDGTARIWDARSGEPLTEPLRHNSAVVIARCSPEGHRVITVSENGRLQAWTTQATKSLSLPLKSKQGGVTAEFSPDGTRILTASIDAYAYVCDSKTGLPAFAPLKCGDNVFNLGLGISAQFDASGSRIVTLCRGKVRLWDAKTGKLLIDNLHSNSAVELVQFSPDGTRLLTVSDDNEARLWDVKSGRLSPDIGGNFAGVLSARFSPEGKRLLTISRDHTVRFWDLQTGQALFEPLTHPRAVSAIAFTKDGSRIVTVDGTARVWDTQTGRPLTEPWGEGDAIESAQFSPDGKLIVTASKYSVSVWQAETGRALGLPMTHSGPVRSVRLSPDGKRIVTASFDFTARIWDVQSGQPLTEPLTPRGLLLSAQFSPDGRRVVTASFPASRVWDIAPSSGQCPDWLLQIVQVISGKLLNGQNVLEDAKLPRVETLDRIRKQLAAASNDDDWVVWGRWFLADPDIRTISPFCSITVPEYIENLIKERTAESLDEAERLASGNPELLERLSQARKTLAPTK